MGDGTDKLDDIPKRRGYYDRFLDSALGQPVVVVEKNNCIIRGILADYGRTRLQLTDARIQHKRGVDVPWIIIDRYHVAHIHPDVKAEPEIRPGSIVVQDTRRGVLMTVDLLSQGRQQEALCTWYEGEDRKQHSFPLCQLRLVAESQLNEQSPEQAG